MPTSTVARLTPEQYLEIERAAESRSEYLDGEMIEMPGATVSHNTIVRNLAWMLHGVLESTAVQDVLHSPEAGVGGFG